jgi:hypothetical protein
MAGNAQQLVPAAVLAIRYFFVKHMACSDVVQLMLYVSQMTGAHYISTAREAAESAAALAEFAVQLLALRLLK